MQNLDPFGKSINDLTIEDLKKLVNDKIPAGYYIEYHNISDNETTDSRTPKINNIVRAITSFANTKGGWCILGVNPNDNYGIMNLKKGTTLKQINAYYGSIKKQINSVNSELFNKIEPKNIPLENMPQSNFVSVMYIPCQPDQKFAFKEDDNGERIYRRFYDAFVPFPDIGGQPFYHYDSIEDIPKNELTNENKSTLNQDEIQMIPIKHILRVRQFHQDNEFKLKKLLDIQPQNTKPIIVYNINDVLVLVDGFYRVAASIEADFKEIRATVKNGTTEQALQESCTANSQKDDRSDATKIRTLETYVKAKGYSINESASWNKSEVEKAIGLKHKFIRDWIKYMNNNININNQNEVVTLSDIAQKFAFSENELNRWIEAIKRKGQAIIYGPPGTGKTFLAKELAKFLTQTKEDETKEDETNEDETNENKTKKKGKRCDIVQFHPSYSYEDFMQGIRPEIVKEKSQDELSTDDQSSTEANGQIKYKWQDGIFLEFCDGAKDYKPNEYCVLIIDEINRANLSSVFGELMYLLEYRGETIKLAGNGKEFEIPKNVLIIGTMNTADRSVSPIDNALRRRFAFLHLPPNTNILENHYNGTNFPREGLQKVLDDVNKKITDENFQLGVSFFLNLKPKDNTDKSKKDYIEDIKDIWKMEIEPYLKDNSFIINDDIQNWKWDKLSKEYDEFKTND